MLRSSLFTASAFALVASASAQTPQQLTAEKVPGVIKNAGIYHVATGTWTRTGGAVSNFGPDTVFSNTAQSGYYFNTGGGGQLGAQNVNYDEGGLPGTTNGNVAGDRDEYTINGFELGYCDFGAAGTAGWDLNFFDEYDPCSVGLTSVANVTVANLPANGCWTVIIDLEGGGEFCMDADGGATFPGWDDDPDLDSFGWSFLYAGTSNAAAGFLLTGDPQETDPTWNGVIPLDGTETYYGPASLCNGTTTGYLTQDFWWSEAPGGGGNSGCYFFGGYSNNLGCGNNFNSYASWYIEMYASADLTCTPPNPTIGVNYGLTNNNSTGSPTTFVAIGSTSVAADNVTLIGGNMQPNSFGFFITSQTQGFAANPGGSEGNIHLGGNIGRFVAPGQIKQADAAGEITLSTTAAEWTLNAIPTSTGPYMAMAGTTTNFQLWHRDQAMGGGATSNFSPGHEIMWTQ